MCASKHQVRSLFSKTCLWFKKYRKQKLTNGKNLIGNSILEKFYTNRLCKTVFVGMFFVGCVRKYKKGGARHPL